MTGRLALVGGDEFRPGCETMDAAILAAAGSSNPTVLIVPTAAAFENPARAADNGVRHFTSLGADASPADSLESRRRHGRRNRRRDRVRRRGVPDRRQPSAPARIPPRLAAAQRHRDQARTRWDPRRLQRGRDGHGEPDEVQGRVATDARYRVRHRHVAPPRASGPGHRTPRAALRSRRPDRRIRHRRTRRRAQRPRRLDPPSAPAASPSTSTTPGDAARKARVSALFDLPQSRSYNRETPLSLRELRGG